jgi:phenylpyruvate tautomerase PptA (4-oxalocrotonate tautomerase family)
MPIYEFQHVLALTAAQKASLARLVTEWHSNTFKSPRFIVNCRFVDIRDQRAEDNYIGGKPFKSNRLFVSLRSGTGRTEQALADMTRKIQSLWDEAVQDIQAPAQDKNLIDVFIMGILDSALERGWFLPMVGQSALCFQALGGNRQC